MREEKGVLVWRSIPGLEASNTGLVGSPVPQLQWRKNGFSGISCNFASVSVLDKGFQNELPPTSTPTAAQLFKHPLALVALVPKDISLFTAGAVSGAAAKSVTAPLDRIKLLMQVFIYYCNLFQMHGLWVLTFFLAIVPSTAPLVGENVGKRKKLIDWIWIFHFPNVPSVTQKIGQRKKLRDEILDSWLRQFSVGLQAKFGERTEKNLNIVCCFWIGQHSTPHSTRSIYCSVWLVKKM